MQELLNKWGIKVKYETILDMWNESHRGYHTQTHLIDVIEQINEQKASLEDIRDYDKLIICGLFHDVIYDPASSTNEEDSADFLMECVTDKTNKHILEIKQMIIDTKAHKAHTPLSEKFNKIDMNIVERDYESLLEWEQGIYKEFGSVYPDNLYKMGRVKFLESLMNNYPNNSANLLRLSEYVKSNY